jgi:hypothetical protein
MQPRQRGKQRQLSHFRPPRGAFSAAGPVRAAIRTRIGGIGSRRPLGSRRKSYLADSDCSEWTPAATAKRMLENVRFIPAAERSTPAVTAHPVIVCGFLIAFTLVLACWEKAEITSAAPGAHRVVSIPSYGSSPEGRKSSPSTVRGTSTAPTARTPCLPGEHSASADDRRGDRHPGLLGQRWPGSGGGTRLPERRGPRREGEPVRRRPR